MLSALFFLQYKRNSISTYYFWKQKQKHPYMSVSIWSVKDLCRPSAGKESACNSGDLGSIPESRRSPGEGIGYPLQYSWASLVVQLVKNLPAMWETWVWSWSWKDLLEKATAIHSSSLAWRIYSPWGCKESYTTERHSFSLCRPVSFAQ